MKTTKEIGLISNKEFDMYREHQQTLSEFRIAMQKKWFSEEEIQQAIDKLCSDKVFIKNVGDTLTYNKISEAIELYLFVELGLK